MPLPTTGSSNLAMNTPTLFLFMACKAKAPLETIKFYLERCQNQEALDLKNNSSDIFEVILNNYGYDGYPIIQSLLEYNAERLEVSSLHYVILLASFISDHQTGRILLDTIKYMLKKGVDVNQKDSLHEWGPLHYAIMLLLRPEPISDQRKGTLLSIISNLVQNGARIDQEDFQGTYPIEYVYHMSEATRDSVIKDLRKNIYYNKTQAYDNHKSTWAFSAESRSAFKHS